MKTERSSVVKSEHEIDEVPYEMETVQSQNTNAQIESLKREKEHIIKELVKTKGQNQKLILQLQQKRRELELLKKSAEERICDLTKNVHNYKSEKNVLEKEMNSEKTKNQNNMKTITNLRREVSLLSAQINGLQSVSQQNHEQSSAENINNSEEFEVESIVDHRILKRHRKFLVKWKDYSSDHDLWVEECDLHCTEILTEYLRENGLSPPKSQ